MWNQLNYISLKKTRNLSKNKDDGPFYLLPIIDKSIINSAYKKSTSILTRFISDQAQKLIKTTEEDLKKPIILRNIKKKIKNNSMKTFFRNRNRTKIQISRNITSLDKKIKKETTEETKGKEEEGEKEKEEKEKEEKEKEEKEKEEKEKEEKEKEEKDIEKEKDIKKVEKLYLTSQESKESSHSKSNKTLNKNSTEINFFWNKNNQNRNQNTFYSKGGNSIDFGGLTKKNESSMSLDRELTRDKFNYYNSTFRRIRTYQPKIEENWKSTHGLTINVGKRENHSPIQNNIDYQFKLIEDQYKLLMDNIQYYRNHIITKDNFLESFKCLSLKNKISYNKALEEACGLLLLLPQLILLEFFKYIEKYGNLHVPNRSKFKEKYIFDETSCLIYNNRLLSELTYYFQNCFEVYYILVKEVDEITLKKKSFSDVLSGFEKARFDICYACNAAENAILNYNSDLDVINKFNKIEHLKYKLNNIDISDKLKNYTFMKKNPDRQRKLRIEACLSSKEEDNNININKEIIFHKKKELVKNKQFKSIVDSELVTKLLKHCKKGAKYQILTQRINNELDESYSEDNQKYKKKTHKVVKLNF